MPLDVLAPVAANEENLTSHPDDGSMNDQDPVRRLKKALQPDQTLVDFIIYHRLDTSSDGTPVGTKQVLAFITRPKGSVIQVALGDLTPISELATWAQGFAPRTPARDFETNARRLRALVWQPLEPYLEQIPTVFIASDGEIGRVPFAALPAQCKGHFLLEERCR